MGELFAFLGRKRSNKLPVTAASAVPLERWEDSFGRQFSTAQIDDDFMFLIGDIERSLQLHAKFAEIQAFATAIRCDYMSPDVCKERDLIRGESMARLAERALDSTRADWAERPSHFGALLSEFNERMHKLKMRHRA